MPRSPTHFPGGRLVSSLFDLRLSASTALASLLFTTAEAAAQTPVPEAPSSPASPANPPDDVQGARELRRARSGHGRGHVEPHIDPAAGRRERPLLRAVCRWSCPASSTLPERTSRPTNRCKPELTTPIRTGFNLQQLEVSLGGAGRSVLPARQSHRLRRRRDRPRGGVRDDPRAPARPSGALRQVPDALRADERHASPHLGVRGSALRARQALRRRGSRGLGVELSAPAATVVDRTRGFGDRGDGRGIGPELLRRRGPGDRFSERPPLHDRDQAVLSALVELVARFRLSGAFGPTRMDRTIAPTSSAPTST